MAGYLVSSVKCCGPFRLYDEIPILLDLPHHNQHTDARANTPGQIGRLLLAALCCAGSRSPGEHPDVAHTTVLHVDAGTLDKSHGAHSWLYSAN